MERKTKVLVSAVPGDDDAMLSRRRVLEGIGWAGLFALAGSQLLAVRPAKAEPVGRPAVDEAPAARAEATEPTSEGHAADAKEVTDVSAHRRYWRRRYWRRRYWRRRYWRARYYHRRRYWRRRYWRRRYWY
jgi:hypothetical protein